MFEIAEGVDQEQATFLGEWFDMTMKLTYEKLRNRYKPEDFIDVTGTVLTPSWHGQECQGNGEHPGIECCCDECDYFLTCFPNWRDQDNQ